MVGPKKRLYSGIVVNYISALGGIILVLFAYLFRDWRTLSWTLLLLFIPYISYYLYNSFRFIIKII
jgi:hypothetical protein